MWDIYFDQKIAILKIGKGKLRSVWFFHTQNSSKSDQNLGNFIFIYPLRKSAEVFGNSQLKSVWVKLWDFHIFLGGVHLSGIVKSNLY